MDGRIYDPKLGRFLSADIVVQNAGNPQNYNRYSYCLNNPLKYTDPSGNISIPFCNSKLMQRIFMFVQQLALQMNWKDYNGPTPHSPYFGTLSINGGPDNKLGRNGGGSGNDAGSISPNNAENTMEICAEGEECGNPPSVYEGGFVSDYCEGVNFMIKMSQINNKEFVEMAMYTLKNLTTGENEYFVQPWFENERGSSNNYPLNYTLTATGESMIQDYDNYSIIDQTHTHTCGEMSRADAFISTSNNFPVYAINVYCNSVYQAKQWPLGSMIPKYPTGSYTSNRWTLDYWLFIH